VGDARFRAKSKAIFRERMKTSGAIMVSHNMRELLEFCDAGLVLENGRMYYFEDLEEAIALHEAIMEA
jgi:capsular polysaccharide transport system ATP-binding protein